MTDKTCCEKCPKRSICVDADKCPRIGPILYRIEHGDIRLKKNKHKPIIRYEAEMDRIEYLIFRNKVYSDFKDE